jgi:hypothetical protein
MSTAISIVLYPVAFALVFTLPAWAISKLLERVIKPGRVKEFLYRKRLGFSPSECRQRLELAEARRARTQSQASAACTASLPPSPLDLR